MALLVGKEAESAGAELSPLTEIANAFSFEAAHSGKVEALHIKNSLSGGGSSQRIALQEDEGGKPKAKAVMVEGVIASTAVGVHEVAVAATAVTKGTLYWLTVEGIGGTTKYRTETAKGKHRKANTKRAEIKLVEAADWNAEETNGEPAIWATGTEEEGGTPVAGKATGALVLTGTATGSAAQKVEGKATGPLLLTGTAAGLAAQVVTGKASGALLLTGTSKGQAAGALLGKASGAILLKGAATGIAAQRVAGKATGTIRLTGTATGIAANRVTGKAAGVLLLTGTAKGTAGAGVVGKASGTLLLTGSATANSAGGALPNHPGVVSPTSRFGVVTPKSLAGLVNPAERQGNG